MSQARQYWAEHLAAIEAEGVSTKAYAEREGLAAASLYFWRRRLKAEGAAILAEAAARPPARFLAVRVAPPVAADAQRPCTVVLPAGLHLELAALPAPAWLAALAAACAQVR